MVITIRIVTHNAFQIVPGTQEDALICALQNVHSTRISALNQWCLENHPRAPEMYFDFKRSLDNDTSGKSNYPPTIWVDSCCYIKVKGFHWEAFFDESVPLEKVFLAANGSGRGEASIGGEFFAP